jgi:plastocyanin
MRKLAAVATASLLGLAACGGGGGGGGPTTPPTPDTTLSASATIAITAAGVDKKQVEVPVGGRVAFVNNDTSAHEMASDPHPIHTHCPPVNQVGGLAPGRTGVSGALNVARTCGFHDHGLPTNRELQGAIVIR